MWLKSLRYRSLLSLLWWRIYVNGGCITISIGEGSGVARYRGVGSSPWIRSPRCGSHLSFSKTKSATARKKLREQYRLHTCVVASALT